MKKLIALVGAFAMGFGLFADEPVTEEPEFEITRYRVSDEFEVGPTNIVGFTDDAKTDIFNVVANDKVQWFADNFPTGEEQLVEFEQPAEVANDETLGNYLKVEADTAFPMLRTLGPVKRTAVGEVTYDSPAYDIGDLGIFIDTKVQLSASEEPPQDFNGKIAVWLHVVPEEKDEDGGVVTEGCTNLMVTCGQLDDDYNVANQPTNIAITAEGVDVKPDAWYQVTIRSIKEIAKDEDVKVPGFVIFINGKLATAVDGASYVIPSTGLTDKAKEFNDKHALFASAIGTGDDAQTLESVGMAGNGGLRYIDLTDAYNAPLFAQDPTLVQITWDEYVESIKIGEVEVTELEGVENYSVKFPVPNFVNKSALVEATVTYKENYRGKSITDTSTKDPAGNSPLVDFAAEDDKSAFSFTIGQFAAGGAVTVVSELDRDEAWFTVGDEAAVSYSSLANLFDVINSDYAFEDRNIKIKLGEDATLTGYNYLYSTGQGDGEIEIDLAGKTITCTYAVTGEEEGPVYMMWSQFAKMTIKDSVGGGKIIVPDAMTAMIYNSTYLVLGKSAEGAIEYTGKILNQCYYMAPDTESGETEGTWASAFIDVLAGKFTDKPICTFLEDEEGNLPEGWEDHLNEGITLGTDEDPLQWSDTQTGGFWTLKPLEATIEVISNDGVSYVLKTNGQEVASGAKVILGETIEVVATLKANEGWKFTSTSVADWTFTDNNTKATYTKTVDDSRKSITITIPATEKIPYTLTLTGGGNAEKSTDPAQGPYYYGDKVKITATPNTGYTYTGVTLDPGWALNDAGAATNTVTFGLANLTVAVPSPKIIKLTVSFNRNGHGGDAPASQTVDYGSKASKPEEDPTDESYTFGGWFENSDCTGTAFDFNTSITASIELFAKWTIKSYTVTYTNGTEQIGSETVNHGSKPASIPAIPAKTGYAFTGWSPSDPTNAVITCATNFVTTYAAIPYAITYEYGAGTGPATANPSPYTIEGAVFTLNEPTPATGYHFTNWSTDKSGVTFNENVMTIAAGTYEPFTVTANYAINTYKVTFKPENGGADIVTNNVEYGTTTASIAPEVSKKGYNFAAWTPALAEKVTANAEYTATWTAIDYNITYAYGEGTGPTPANTATYQISGTDQTVTLNVPTPKAGFHFTNWTVATKEGVSIDGNTLKIVAGTIGAIAVTANYAPNVYFPQSDIEDQYKDRDGTEAKPFVIRKYADLVALQEMVAVGQTTAGKYFEQVADIDFTGKDPWNGIGAGQKNFTTPFKGVYDGSGNKITNLVLARNKYCGLFNDVVDGAISNLTVQVNGFATGDADCGGSAVAGCIKNTVISRVKAEGTLTSNHNLGGISAFAVNSTYEYCTNTVALTNTEEGEGRVGGIVAVTEQAPVTFKGCVSTGAVSGPNFTFTGGNDAGSIGGIVGFIAHTNTFDGCVVTAELTGGETAKIGTFWGWRNGNTATKFAQIVTGGSIGPADIQPLGGNMTGDKLIGVFFATDNGDGTVTYAAPAAEVAAPAAYKVMYANAQAFTLTDPAASLTIVTNLAAYSGTVALDSSLTAGYNLAVGGDATKVVYTPALKTYTITFYPANGGETIISNNVPHFTAFADVAPKDLAKTGYTFVGWDPEGAMVTGDAEYTAQWETISYPITYEYVNATAPAESNKESYVITDTGTPITLTRPTVDAGYAFQSWTSDQGANVAFDNENNTMTIKEGFVGAIKVTATATAIPYAITYDYGAGTGPATSNQQTYVISTEAQTIHLTAPTPARGYDFTGFALKENHEGVTFNDKTNMVIAAGQIDPISVKANYQVITYTIGYAMDGGTAPQGSPTSYTVNDSITLSDEATKDGHNFTGWTWEGQSTPKKNVTIPAGRVGNITFTAHWEIREFVQEFMKNIEAEVSNLPAKTNVAWHTKLIRPATDPSCEGYRFDGWYKDEHCTEEFDFNQSIEAAHFIYAKWVKTFKVTFTAGEGIESISVDGADYTSGTELVKDTNTVVNVTATVLEGYNEFAGASYTIVCNTNVTLATTLKVYEVTFADGAHSKITPAAGTSNIVHGTQVTVTATADENYEFAAESYAGWTKQSNSTLTTNVTVTAAATFKAPDATATPVAITVPAADKLPAGVAELKIYQRSGDNQEWKLVEDGRIVVGNKWKVEGTAADGYTVKNPIASGTAELGKAISVTEAQVKSAVTYTVTVPQLVNFTVAVTNGETEVGTTNGVYTFNYASNVKVAFAAAEGYQITADTSTNIVSLVDNVVITAPTVEIKKYTVTFKPENGGETIVSNNVPHFTPFANVAPKDLAKTGYTFAGWDPEGAMVTSNAEYTAQWTINKFTLTIPAVDHASAVVSNATDEVSERVFDYGTQVTVYWTAEAGWKITSGATEAIEMTEDKTAATPVVEKAEITVTVKKGTGIKSITVGGEELDFDSTSEATFAVPADDPTATLTLVADNLTIPVYKMSIGKDSFGWSVTNKTPVITADAENVSKNYFTFTAEEAEVTDPTVSEDQKKDAIIDAMGGNEDAVEKVNNIVTTETTPAEGKVTATELATWITEKTISSSAIAGSDYIVASVKLDMDSPITEDTKVKVATVEKTSDLAVTVKVGEENATKEQIKSYVELCDDLGVANDWEKLPVSALKSAVKIEDGKLVITPKAGIDKLFLRVVITKDPAK